MRDTTVLASTAQLQDTTRRDRATVACAFVAAISCAFAAHSLRQATSTRVDTLVVQPAVWLAPIAVLAFLGRRRIADAIDARGWSYFGFMAGGLQLGIGVVAGFAFGFGRSPWSSSPPFTLAGFLWRALAILVGQEVIRSVLARGLARREGVALIVPWLALWVATVPWAGVDRLFDRDTALPYLGAVLLPAGAASLLATYLALRGGALASIAYLAPLTTFELLSPALPSLPWGVATIIGVGVPAVALVHLPDTLEPTTAADDAFVPAESTSDDLTTESTASRRRFTWFHAALCSMVLGYFSIGLLGFTPTVIHGVSMEPGMHTGDLVITREVDPSELEVGDVIRFRRPGGAVVHRIIEVRTGSDGAPEFITQGDNNPAPDSPVAADDVIGEVTVHLPKIGLPIYWIRSVMS